MATERQHPLTLQAAYEGFYNPEERLRFYDGAISPLRQYVEMRNANNQLLPDFNRLYPPGSITRSLLEEFTPALAATTLNLKQMSYGENNTVTDGFRAGEYAKAAFGFFYAQFLDQIIPADKAPLAVIDRRIGAIAEKPDTVILKPDSSLEENLAYWKSIAPGLLDSPTRFPNYPYKGQMWAGLVKAGLADPDTRCYPLWDIFSSGARVAHLIGQGRTVWISTAKVEDFAYEGIPITNPEYVVPQDIPNYTLKLQQLALDMIADFPSAFPSNGDDKRTSPLFRGLSTLRSYFMEAAPRLFALSREDPTALCKIFPQDREELSHATAVIDLDPEKNGNDEPGLGPSITFEATGTYTPRGEKKAKHLVRYYPRFNLIYADFKSAALFYKIFTGFLRGDGLFLAKVNQLMGPEFLNTDGVALEIMINRKGEPAFCPDVIPISSGAGNPVNLVEVMKKLAEALVIDPDSYPNTLKHLSAWKRGQVIVPEAEQGIPTGELHTIFSAAQDTNLPTIPFPDRPTQRQVANFMKGHGTIEIVGQKYIGYKDIPEIKKAMVVRDLVEAF